MKGIFLSKLPPGAYALNVAEELSRFPSTKTGADVSNHLTDDDATSDTSSVADSDLSVASVDNMDPSLWCRFPTELLFVVVDWLVVGYEKSRRGWGDFPLQTLALVCRGWLERCAPVLYRQIRLNGLQQKQVSDFFAVVRLPGNLFHLHTTTLTLRAMDARKYCATLSRLSIFLPNLKTLQCFIQEWNTSWQRHPSGSKILAGSFGRFKNVSVLILSSCTFHSSLDLLRILAVLPALYEAKLWKVTWVESLDAMPPSKLTRLVVLTVTDCTHLWPLLGVFTLPHPSTLPTGVAFPGLSQYDAHILLMVIQLYVGRSWTLVLHKSLYPQTCMYTSSISQTGRSHCANDAGILEVQTHFNRLEFHICHPEYLGVEDVKTITGLVRWIVFKISDPSLTLFNLDGEHMAKLDDYLMRLQHLERIVLETDESAKAPPEEVPVKNGSRMHVWSRSSAEEYAAIAKVGGVPTKHQFPISPRQ